MLGEAQMLSEMSSSVNIVRLGVAWLALTFRLNVVMDPKSYLLVHDKIWTRKIIIL